MSPRWVVGVVSLLSAVIGVPAQTLQFADPVTVPVSYKFASPYRAVVRDLNGDSLPDLVVSQTQTWTLVIAPGAKGRAFRPPIYLKTPGPCGPIAVLDFNGDEAPDIAAGCMIRSSVFAVLLFRNDGDFHFTDLTQIYVDPPVADLLAVDLNADGKTDLAVTQGKALRVFFGDGKGLSEAHYAIPLYSSSAFLRAADFNNDATTDLLVWYQRSPQLLVLLNDGTGHLAQNTSTINTPNYVAVGDFNGDGKVDLATCSSSPETVRILAGDGTGVFSPWTAFEMPSDLLPTVMESADLDSNGLADLIVGHYYEGSVRVLRNNGEGKMSLSSYALYGDMFQLTIADVDRDSKLDLVVPSVSASNVTVAFGNGEAGFPAQRVLGTMMDVVFAADLDNDGNPDAAVLDKMAGCLQLVRQGTEPAGGLCVPNIAYTAVMGDFNQDGFPDFAVTGGLLENPTDRMDLTVFLGNGDLTFRRLDPVQLDPGAVATVSGDFNGDGIPDLAAQGGQILQGKKDGTFNFRRDVFGPTLMPSAAADFDGDGQSDLVVLEREGPAVNMYVLLASSDGTFRRGSALKTDFFVPFSVQLKDLNADGLPDITAGAAETIYTFFGRGDGTFTEGLSAPRTGGYSSSYYVAVADVNGDGVPDVIAPDAVNNQAEVFLRNADGTFGPTVRMNAGPTPLSVATADFNRCGKPELLFASKDNGTVTFVKLADTH